MALDKITTGIINDDAVTAAKIVAGAVGTSEIADGTVVAADIAANSVGTSEIADSVTLVTPNLGTPSAGVATNLTSIPAANLSGTITSGTQDAITRLGTVTVGNLSNTAIVYPAGHIVNSWIYSHNFSASDSMALSNVFSVIDYGGTGQAMQITGITATEGNILHITANPGNIRQDYSNSYVTDVGFRIDTSDFITLDVFYLIQSGSSANRQQIKANASTGMVYTVPASFTNKTISCRAAHQSSAPGVHNIEHYNVVTNFSISMVIYEIQQ